MTALRLSSAILIWVTLTNLTSGAVRYVNAGNPVPAHPFTNWASAAVTIQDAVDASVTGDEILVTNGVYRTGGRAVYLTMTNRVAVTKPITLRSINGPDATLIEGYQLPGTTNGAGAVRCVYLTNGALLSGFTLTNGATLTTGTGINGKSGGGVWCASTNSVLSNCVVVANSSAFGGGGVYSGTLRSCRIENNRTDLTGGTGGGAHMSTLSKCSITGNQAAVGGGIHSAIAIDCILAFNSAANSSGGGAYEGSLTRCTVISNSASISGGGAIGAIAINSLFRGNSAQFAGGATGWLTNCTLLRNFASDMGGGASFSTLVNCTVTENQAFLGGGTYFVTAFNSIIHENLADTDPNYSEGVFNHCCLFPLPPAGSGNITNLPQLVDSLHVSANSPCRGAGNSAYSSGVDVDGEAWANPPSIGADEFYSGSATGLLTVTFSASYTNVATGFPINFQGDIAGHATANRWELGDGTVLSNRLTFSHSWINPGIYPVILRAYNISHPLGISTTSTVYVLNQPTHYVSPTNLNPVPPYLSWATAATNIQEAVDAAFAGGTVWVTNGVYDQGGRILHGALSNRVAITKPLSLRSVNGPQVTKIRAYQSPLPPIGTLRCVYLANHTLLEGFTLTGGFISEDGPAIIRSPLSNGGGVWCDSQRATVENCWIVNNSADSGGGASSGTFTNCTIIQNTASEGGGGVEQAILNNCIVSSNSAIWGGGASRSTLNGCTINGNTGPSGGGVIDSTVNDSLLEGNQSQGLSEGGAALTSQLNKCIVRGNRAGRGGGLSLGAATQTVFRDNYADNSGGASYYSTLTNCTVVNNSASLGGGVYGGGLFNSIIHYNSAPNGENTGDVGLVHCCSTPFGFGDARNLTNAPNFVDLAAGDLRLAPDSPCINAGNNASAPSGLDLDGNNRIVGGTVDLGAYELQTPQSVISHAYLNQFGLPTDGSIDYVDADGDGFTTWQEWRAFTDPTDSQSLLKLLPPVKNPSGVTLRWIGVRGRNYYIEKSTNILSVPQFFLLSTGIPGPGETGQTNSWTDFNPTSPQSYYRLGVTY